MSFLSFVYLQIPAVQFGKVNTFEPRILGQGRAAAVASPQPLLRVARQQLSDEVHTGLLDRRFPIYAHVERKGKFPVDDVSADDRFVPIVWVDEGRMPHHHFVDQHTKPPVINLGSGSGRGSGSGGGGGWNEV